MDTENQNSEANVINVDEVTKEDIKSLINLFAKKSYNAGTEDPEADAILERCIRFLELDYRVAVVGNDHGELSCNYPRKLPILEYEKRNYSDETLSPKQTNLSPRKTNISPQRTNLFPQNTNTSPLRTGLSPRRTNLSPLNTSTSPLRKNLSPQTNIQGRIDVKKVRELINNAKFSRCRARFPIPVIMYKDKYICRSSTLSKSLEMYGRTGLQHVDSYISRIREKASEDEEQEQKPAGALTESPQELKELAETDETAVNNENCKTAHPQFFDQIRNCDIELLKYFKVGTIIDIMVENQKVKYGMYMSSSEKVEKVLYHDFNLICMPYPGCEFFKDFRDRAYEAEGLHFNFNHSQCDAPLNIPEDPSLATVKIDWDNYKSWDLVTLTQNYIKYILQKFEDSTSGILLHCISGWDRTPLFISLLRISLWADGLIHRTLDEYQMLYFTIAYDWMLFGHQLVNRLNKGEEIFFFCFFVLKYLTKSGFASSPRRHKMKRNEQQKISEDYDNNMEILFENEMKEFDNSRDNSPTNCKFSGTNNSRRYSGESNGNPVDNQDALETSAPLEASGTCPVAVPTRSTSDDSATSTETADNYGFLMIGPTGSVQESSMPIQTPRESRLGKLRNLFYVCYFNSGAQNIQYATDSYFATYLSNVSENWNFFKN